MGNAVHQLKIGNFHCAVISDGTANLVPNAAKFLFSNAPEMELEQALRRYHIERYEIPYRMNCLYINTGQHQILVDTGFGAGIHPDLGKLSSNLQSLKVTPEEIDILILTHGHGDHIGATTDHDGKPRFPRARLLMAKAEWDYWTSAAEAGKLDEHNKQGVQTKLLPFKDQVELIEQDVEVVSGIQIIAAPGHTSGHMAISVKSEGEELLHIVDTVLDPIHVEYPDWLAPVDMQPEQTVATRRTLLARAATEQPLILAYHFAFPGLGHISASEHAGSWLWKPV